MKQEATRLMREVVHMFEDYNTSLEEYGFQYILSEDEYVVLGDNVNESEDSREHGFISRKDIKGVINNKL